MILDSYVKTEFVDYVHSFEAFYEFILTLILIRAVVGRLRDKWIGYNQTQRIGRSVSLFISPSGERVAVAAGNQITILRKEDDYLDPFGIFLGIVSLLKISCKFLIYFVKDRQISFQLLTTYIQDYVYSSFFFFLFLICFHFISIF